MIEQKKINEKYIINSLQSRIGVLSSNCSLELAECYAIIEQQREEIEILQTKVSNLGNQKTKK